MKEMKKYEFCYVTSLQDTNVVGNIYFANFIAWQGKCREFFLKEKAPDILKKVEKNEIALITLSCSCNYLGELKAFDEVQILLSLNKVEGNRITMEFEYFKIVEQIRKLVATGTHEIGCFERVNDELQPIPIPESLKLSLREYQLQ